MITCPNCNHQNPDGALQCEACYTPLPALAICPNCQASVQADASFCGQCGNDLRAEAKPTSTSPANATSVDPPAREPISEPESESLSEFSQSIDFSELVDFRDVEASTEPTSEASATPDPEAFDEPELTASVEPAAESAVEPATEPASAAVPAGAPLPPPATATPATQIQASGATLKHVQTQTRIAVPSQLSVVQIGKPNEHTPPDIDVSGFPNSEIVSRVHANLVIEDDVYYLEDMGSSNGTYINGLPLPTGNRHRLHGGDRVAFGKGDKVSFIFEAAGY